MADITYIRIRSSFVYLAAILDLYSRRIVGWAISKRIDTELCVTALRTVECAPGTGEVPSQVEYRPISGFHV